MSRVETIKIKNAKIKSQTLNKICKCFSKDLTAIQTANYTGYSRQTINHYYKIFRNRIIERNVISEFKLANKLLNNNTIEIKYFNIYNHNIFYIENHLGVFVLNNQSNLPKQLAVFMQKNIETSLINHKRANCVRILFNQEKISYVVSGYFKSENNFELFLQNRLKKFRGINKNNFHTHLNESIFRYNLKTKVYKELLSSLL